MSSYESESYLSYNDKINKDFYKDNLEEKQYFDILYKILEEGKRRDDRTGTGVKSLFAPPPMRFNLGESFPLITSKHVSLRIVFTELIWFIRGQTDSKILHDKKVFIWDANGSREFLDKRGLTNNREGDLGPIYGFQWRHFGATYIDCDTDYTGQGVDQLAQVIEKILFEPNDRRIILSAWNPDAIPSMALPPCHMFCQFYVDDDKLSCQLYQRSADMGLGVPFNISSYALFTCMIAHLCGLEPGEFIHVIGDSHIYLNLIDAIDTQLTRKPRPFPTLKINKEMPLGKEELSVIKTSMIDRTDVVKKIVNALESFEYSDIELIGYDPYPAIKMNMSV